MHNYLMRVQYIGKNFAGFQKQSNHPQDEKTVQGEIEKVLKTVLRAPVNTYGAARTDAGVNALNQYLNFYYDDLIDYYWLKNKMNHLLFDEGIFVKEVREVPITFHARKSAKSKIYAYLVSSDLENSMFLMPYVYIYKEPLDMNMLKIALDGLKGKHDFSIFANVDKSQKDRNNICELFDTGYIERGSLTILYFHGDRFLYHMVRRMVYYVLKGAQGYIDTRILLDPFSFGKKVPFTRQVLPPEPLFLVNVIY
ncbi:tRNA pseudouridine synthase A [Caldisericum exile]|uniref:tRNA pseudouridine synthase A n=1 Tax=Caldisericum exile (strain DSM 21853 / NBRC 104410 / AZM16c01) TaxID=511051 RepID=A0A7U6GF42_CALEA|nr:tRNA pseudouridine synthase A [Caldisericum exile]BAL81235.1 tRNA pseudouridine synthase A [Caldisericum exile AZM16c01]